MEYARIRMSEILDVALATTAMQGIRSQTLSLVNRAQSYLRRLPICTKTVLLVCVSLAALDAVPLLHLPGVACLNAELVTKRLQVYRLILSAVVHNGLIHLALNMLAFVPTAAALERQLGSLRLAHLMGLLLLAADLVYMACSGLLEHFLPQQATCTVGLSGVLFALIVVETHVNAVQQRSFYGLFTLPAAYYPWLLLVVWQLAFPQVSFFGHLGGILAGMLYSRGMLTPVIPSASTFQAAEQWLPFRLCLPFDACISSSGAVPSHDLLPVSFSAPRHTRGRAGAGSEGISSASFSGWLGLTSAVSGATASAADAESRPTSSSSGQLQSGPSRQPPGPQGSEKPDPRKAAAAAAEARAAQAQPPSRGVSGRVSPPQQPP